MKVVAAIKNNLRVINQSSKIPILSGKSTNYESDYLRFINRPSKIPVLSGRPNIDDINLPSSVFPSSTESDTGQAKN
jgi:hypothetical protein